LACSKKARTWFTLDIDGAAERVGARREAVVEAMEGLAQKGDLTLKVSGLRHGYRLLQPGVDVDALAASLSERFAAAEVRDLARIDGILEMATGPGCLTGALLSYFGEELPGPCGHCDRCMGEAIQPLPPAVPYAFGGRERAVVEEVRGEGHQALGSSRQLARFLCGLPSPAVGRARLRKHGAFGALRQVPFDQVLAFVEG
jgi:ATP-dependent DNA helicase RecQ